MKVICNRLALLESINSAAAATSPRSPKPVLAGIKMVVTKDDLILTGTDLEIAIECRNGQVQVDAQGETVVNVEKLRDIVRESDDETLSLSLEGTELHIRGADSHFKLLTMDPKDFPPTPSLEKSTEIHLAAGTLKSLIKQTAFATAREGTRYAFNGILMKPEKDRVSFVATDGRRLALAKGNLSAKIKSEKPITCIIPVRAMTMIEKILHNDEDEVTIGLGENQAVFKAGDSTLFTNLLEGQFPDYEEVIPKENDKVLSAGREALLSAIQRGALLTSEESKGVRMDFSGKNGLTITSRNPESGEAKVDFASKFTGASISIGFNPRFLGEGLKVAQTDEVSFELSAPNRPGLLKSGEEWLYVLMPTNLN